MSDTLTETENKLTFMKASGLHLFSEVVMNQDDGAYYLPAKIAQATRQFYWFERKQIIIVLTHTETTFNQGDQPTHLSGNWSVDAHIGFLRSWEQLAKLAPGGEVSEIPFFGTGNCELSEHGFRDNGGSYSGMEKLVTRHFYSKGSGLDCPDAEGVANAAIFIKNKVEPYVRLLPFAELWVHGFAFPHEFEGCEKTFWSRFDKRNLRALVTRPYGSAGLER
jgi:hypothetical protein